MRNLVRLMPILILAVWFAPGGVTAQTTAFTYQGRLTDGANPTQGSYEFQFKLFDTAIVGTGTQQGATVAVSNVAVMAGIFTVQLDFGVGAFPGAQRFLEIAVKPASGTTFTVLSPRQVVTATPYAIKSANAAAADSLSSVCVNCVTSSQIQSLPTGSANYIQNATAQQTASNFNISGAGTANIFNAATQYNIAGDRVLSVTGTANTFTGVGAGQSNMTGGSNAFFGAQAGRANTTGNGNSFFGSNAGNKNTDGMDNAFFGNGAGLNNTLGDENAFFGRSAGVSNTTGGLNSFFGVSAGAANSLGSRNSFFGAFAGQQATSFNNSFFGADAGANNTTGDHNSFFGISAGKKNTVANSNSFFGASAGSNNTTGGSNSFLGFGTGINNTTGSNNTFIGRSAGNPSTSTQVNNSTAIGAFATVSTSNTIVLGTGTETTIARGKFVTGTSGGIAPGAGYLETFFVTSHLQGLFTPNLVVGNALNNPGSDFPLCFQNQSLGTIGGIVLTRCFSSFSSLTKKTDVQPFAGGLEIIKRLKPVSFKWKHDGTAAIGLNAEEVAEIAPSLISSDDKGEVKNVKESSLTVLFINAFKEQQAQSETQAEQIKAQQAQLKQQQQQLDALKKLVCQANPQASVCLNQE